jgi:hypothetical protein
MSAARTLRAALGLALAGGAFAWLAGCAAGIPVTRPAAVEEQARRSATIVAGTSTRADVRAALGEPWLASRAWGFEAFQVQADQRELTFVSLLTPPVPIGVFRRHMSGYVLAIYDDAGVVMELASGSGPDDDSRGLWLHAGGVALGRAAAELGSMQVLADPAALAAHLDRCRRAPDCTLALSCEPSPDDRWLDESCPDRVSVDGGAPFDLRGFFASCEGGKCTEGARERGGFGRLPVVVPLPLAPGPHALAFASSTFKGRDEQSVSCGAGDVIYGLVRGQVKRHWWGPKQSTLTVRAELSEREPPEIATRRGLLYRGGRWLAAPEPAPER